MKYIWFTILMLLAVIASGSVSADEFDDFRTDTAECGLRTDLELATWDLHPFTEDADFLVTVLRSSRVHDAPAGDGDA